MSSQAPCWANFGKAEGTPQLKLALQLVTKMPFHFKFGTKQEIIISFYFRLRILNATWHMATSKRLFCHFLHKQTTVTNAVLEVGLWSRHKKELPTYTACFAA